MDIGEVLVARLVQLAVLNHVLSQTTGRECSHAVDVGEPAVVGRGTGVLELAEHVAHDQCVCCHNVWLRVNG